MQDENIASVESWCGTACVRVIFHYVGIEYEEGGTAKQAKASPRKPARWYTPLCRLAPLIVMLLWIAAYISKAIYPIRGSG